MLESNAVLARSNESRTIENLVQLGLLGLEVVGRPIFREEADSGVGREEMRHFRRFVNVAIDAEASYHAAASRI